MAKFKVELDIRANGRKWYELLSGLFGKKEVRDAWSEMESNFSKETVSKMISAINRFTDEPEETISYTVLDSGRTVVAEYFNKGASADSSGVSVAYTVVGNLDKPVTIEYNEADTVS
jgi:hypothetical protein